MGEETAALARAVDVVGDRWTLLLLHALLDGPQRYADLERAVPGISTSVLASRLRDLETARVVVATPYQGRPTRHTYELTARGRELAGVVRLLTRWGGAEEGEAVRHDVCGSPVDAVWWCRTCDRPVEDPVADLVRV